MSETDNLFLRANLEATGEIPEVGKTYTSPDIIPYGTEQVDDPATLFTTEASYATNPGRNIMAGEANYIYVRAKNLYTGGAIQGGQVALYWVVSGTAWETADWTLIESINGEASSPISAENYGDVVVADDAFLWVPPDAPDGYHYCLIALISTTDPDDPNDVPTFTSSQEFVEWKVTNLQVSQRNISYDSGSDDTKQFVQDVKNLSPTLHEDMLITVTCNGVSDGTSISVYSPSTELTPAVDYGTDPEDPIVVNNDPYVYNTPLTNFPPVTGASIVVTLVLPEGTTWPEGATVDITSDLPVAADSDAKYAVSTESLGLRIPGLDRVVRIGGVQWIFGEPPARLRSSEAGHPGATGPEVATPK